MSQMSVPAPLGEALRAVATPGVEATPATAPPLPPVVELGSRPASGAAAAVQAVEIEPGSRPASGAAAVEIVPGSASEVEAAVATDAGPPPNEAAGRNLKVWAVFCVLGFGVAIAIFALEHIYMGLPFIAVGFFLAALVPGLLLSIHIILQDVVDMGVDDLMLAAGDEDESCGYRSVLQMWAKANAANVVLFLLIALFSLGWLVAFVVKDPSKIKSPAVAAVLVLCIVLVDIFFLFAARAGKRAVDEMEKMEANPPTAAIHVLAPPPTANVAPVVEP